MAALALIERDGLEAFSTRKLAAALGCEAMSIYHYFPSKAHLMDALLDRVLSGLTPPPVDLPATERIRRFAHQYRDLAHRNPKFFPFAALHRMNTRVGLGALETMIGMFRDAGLGVEEAARLFRVLGYYLVGAALDETSGYAKGPSAAEPVPDAIVARDFPAVAAVGPYFRPEQHRVTFDLGLDLLLAEIERGGA